jgi:hypothetical protein
MNSYAGRILAQNAQHRTDQALGTWQATGRGLNREYSNFEGYTLRKTRDGYRWLVYDPKAQVVNPYPSCEPSVHSLTEAKQRAEDHMARTSPNRETEREKGSPATGMSDIRDPSAREFVTRSAGRSHR